MISMAQERPVNSPMVQFKVLSNTFDEEKSIGPNKVAKVKSLYKNYDKQLKTLNKLGIDKTKN